MHIPIPIPIVAKNVAAVQGVVWKVVSCANCQQDYAYLLELEATGEDHDLLFLDGEGSAKRARVNAEHNLMQKSRNVVLPVPCPNCGHYQDDMSQLLKDDASINSPQIAGMVIAIFSLVPLAFEIPYIWAISVVLATVGLALLTYGYLLEFRFDPNSGDSEPRKTLGQKHAVWGERLNDLLATNPNAKPTSIDDGDKGTGS